MLGMNTSTTTSSTSGADKETPQLNIKKKDLTDANVQTSISKMKNTQINVVDEQQMNEIPVKLSYISNIKDETGQVSKPFTQNGKRYQMVRAMNEKREKTNGVYCLDEINEEGDNIIHTVEAFEKMIQSVPPKEEPIQEEKKESGLAPLNLSSYKFFLVNKKTGGMRKFKTAEQLADTTKKPDETFMSLSQYRKYIESTIFGGKKKEEIQEVITEDDTDQTLQRKAIKLMDYIKQRIPESTIESVKTNRKAQKEVILSFAEMIGVPRNFIGQIISNVKNMSKSEPKTTTDTDGQAVPTFTK